MIMHNSVAASLGFRGRHLRHLRHGLFDDIVAKAYEVGTSAGYTKEQMDAEAARQRAAQGTSPFFTGSGGTAIQEGFKTVVALTDTTKSGGGGSTTPAGTETYVPYKPAGSSSARPGWVLPTVIGGGLLAAGLAAKMLL